VCTKLTPTSGRIKRGKIMGGRQMRGWEKSEGKTVTKQGEDRNIGKEGETEKK
jgi:hypothetical protein